MTFARFGDRVRWIDGLYYLVADAELNGLLELERLPAVGPRTKVVVHKSVRPGECIISARGRFPGAPSCS